MKFADFTKRALSNLIGNQQEDGTWWQDDATTFAALEALLEAYLGPKPFCTYSRIYQENGDNKREFLNHFDALSIVQDTHLYRQSLRDDLWSLTDHGRDNTPGIEAIRKVIIAYTQDRIAPIVNNWTTLMQPWLAAKWLRFDAHSDSDFQRWGEASRLEKYESKEPWLLAQIGYTCLHFHMHPFIEGEKITQKVTQLVELAQKDHWESQTTSPEETTAIVTWFLSHPCTTYSLKAQSTIRRLKSFQSKTAQWLLRRQASNGGWINSVQVTAHCLKALSEIVESNKVNSILQTECIDAIEAGIRYLLHKDIISLWDGLRTYEQIEVFSTLIQISRDPYLWRNQIFESIDIESMAVQPNIFISYGSPDAEFARRLATNLEANGLRVWFAEWDIDYGNNWVQELEAGLEVTKNFIIVLSPEAIERPWVRQELSVAFEQALGGDGKLILPLMYRQCKPPVFLRTYQRIDFTDDSKYDSVLKDLVRRLKGQKRERS